MEPPGMKAGEDLHIFPSNFIQAKQSTIVPNAHEENLFVLDCSILFQSSSINIGHTTL